LDGRVYRQVCLAGRLQKIFTMAAEYKPPKEETTLFFQTIQNALRYASNQYAFLITKK